MKKILLIAPHVSGRGGTETVLRTVTKMLMEKSSQYAPKIFVLGGCIDKKWLVGLPCKESKYYNNKILRNIIYFFALLRELSHEHPDIVISLDPMICLLVNKVRYLTHKNYPIVSWIHFSLINSKVRSHLIPNADYHLAISSGIAKQLENLHISKDKIFTIYNPIERNTNIIKVPENKTVFIYIGRIIFEGQKRLKDLINALAQVEGNWMLEVYGDGTDIDICRQYAKKVGIESKINWHGYVSNPWDNIKEATALILTSAYEGMPMVLVEAISRGVYCISSDCKTGPNDIIKNGLNGQLYSPNCIRDLQRNLNDLVKNEHTFNQWKIKESLINFYTDKYSHVFEQSISKIIEDYYKNLK